MKVFITGGNGFVGRHLVVALQQRGDDVRALASPTGNTSWLELRGVEIFRGDVRAPQTLLLPMRGVDAVVHLVAQTRKCGPLQDSYAVNVVGTENVCRAAMTSGVRRIVHASTFTVYNMAVGRPVTEDDPLAPLREAYSTTKAQGDRVVQRMIAEEHLPAVIIRLGALFGPGDDRNFGRLAARVQAGKGIVVGSGDNAVPFVYISDVVQGLRLALDEDRAVGRVYNIGNDQPITQKQFLSAIADDLGVAPRQVHVPYGPMYAAAYVAECLTALSGYRVPPIVTRHGVKILGEDGRLSIARARSELGYTPQVTVRDGVRRTVAWYKEASEAATPGRIAV
jgi:nucleoside-diphosphate-sugar epimerase